MKLPDDIKSLRDAFVARFPVPQGEPGEAHEENVRQWSIRFAEQVAFQRPGMGWGMKRADPNRPISKDTLARSMDGKLFIWDMLLGTGTGAPRINPDPEAEEVTGQVFVPVAQVNHLGVPAAPPATPTPLPTDQVPVDPRVVEVLAALLATQEALVARVGTMEMTFSTIARSFDANQATIKAMITALHDAQAHAAACTDAINALATRPWPAYSGRLAVNMRLVPEVPTPKAPGT